MWNVPALSPTPSPRETDDAALRSVGRGRYGYGYNLPLSYADLVLTLMINLGGAGVLSQQWKASDRRPDGLGCAGATCIRDAEILDELRSEVRSTLRPQGGPVASFLHRQESAIREKVQLPC